MSSALELFHHPTTWPGARLPHCWLGRAGREVSTHDVVGKAGFAVSTGITGWAWADAARTAADGLGVAVRGVIGPGCEHTDLYDDCARWPRTGARSSGPTRTSPGARRGWWTTPPPGSSTCSPQVLDR